MKGEKVWQKKRGRGKGIEEGAGTGEKRLRAKLLFRLGIERAEGYGNTRGGIIAICLDHSKVPVLFCFPFVFHLVLYGDNFIIWFISYAPSIKKEDPFRMMSMVSPNMKICFILYT